MEPVVRTLPVNLTYKEREERAKELADAITTHDQIDEERKDVAKDFRERLKGANKNIRRLAVCVARGTEDRPTVCEWRSSPERALVYLVRCDTGETIESRAMSAAEREAALQPGLPGLPKDPPPPEAEEYVVDGEEIKDEETRH